MALEWSNRVNNCIQQLSGEDRPFQKVKEGLAKIEEVADIAIVSSANSRAVAEEWSRHDLVPHVAVMCGQEAGTKAYCIGELKKKGFSDDQVLMVGDAPGDLEAAKKNHVLFYPIIVGKEAFSWERLANEALQKFLDGSFKEKYQEQLIDEFYTELK